MMKLIIKYKWEKKREDMIRNKEWKRREKIRKIDLGIVREREIQSENDVYMYCCEDEEIKSYRRGD